MKHVSTAPKCFIENQITFYNSASLESEKNKEILVQKIYLVKYIVKYTS